MKTIDLRSDRLAVRPAMPRTNMVFVDAGAKRDGLTETLCECDIIVSGDRILRLMTHLDVSADDIGRVVDGLRAHCA